jgi:hypothetical protein
MVTASSAVAGRTRVVRRAVRALLVLAMTLPFSGCTARQLEGDSSAYLILNSIVGFSGAKPGEFNGVLASDVVTNVNRSVNGQQVASPTIYEDGAQVTFRLGLKDPGATDAPAVPSTTNFITVTRYHVRYIRADGRNTPGVDVPYAFDSAITATVGNGTTTSSLTLVRAQAKLEAPLAALANGGGAVMISTIAEVTFYGTDQAGREVSVVGTIGVNFGDWGDPA